MTCLPGDSIYGNAIDLGRAVSNALGEPGGNGRLGELHVGMTDHDPVADHVLEQIGHARDHMVGFGLDRSVIDQEDRAHGPKYTQKPLALSPRGRAFERRDLARRWFYTKESG